jgi:hypothetical protein
MEEVLEVIEQARESYLSKDGQLKVIYDAYSKYKRNVEFVPSALVASEEAREAAQHGVQPTCFSCGHNLDKDGICTNLLCAGPFTAGG